MGILNNKAKLPTIIAGGSFLCLLLILLTTSPFDKIGYAIVFFAIFMVFGLSFGHLIAFAQTGKVTAVDRYKIAIVSLFIIIFLMFRSTQSLSWIDAMVLALIIFGLLFYVGRRSS